MANEFRITKLEDMILPESIKNHVNLIIQASKKSGKLPGHIMLDGIAGGGKTTLANIIANELGVEFVECGLSTNFVELIVRSYKENKPNSNIRRIYFIDEAHAIPKKIFEMLLTVLENNQISLSRNGMNYNLDLPNATWIIATTNPEVLPRPFINRFRHHLTFYPYADAQIKDIARVNLSKFNLTLDNKALDMLVRISRQTPRNLNSNILNLHDYTSISNTLNISNDLFREFMTYVGIDEYGFTENERAVIRVLGDGPNLISMPLKTLATITGVDELTLKDNVEPFLTRMGVMQITTRGRMLTQYGNDLFKKLF